MKKWKTINNFKNVIDDYYEVSYEGEVRIKETKKILHKKIVSKKKHPYYAVSLKQKNGKIEWILVHQLVASFFCKIPIKYLSENVELVPDHLDNNGLNNHYKNLEWKTRGENVSSAFKEGYINNSGENHSSTSITNKQVRKICEYLEKDMSYDQILEKMKFPNNKSYRSLLVRIKNRVAWKSISKDYDFDKKKIKYTKSQSETIKYLPLIRQMIEDGKRNIDIIHAIWGENCDKIKSKDMTIRKIRNNEIYTEIH